MTMNLIITPIPIQLIDFMWPQAEKILKRAIDMASDEVSLETTKAGLLRGSQTMVAVLDKDKVIAVNIMEVVTFETGLKALTITITAGNKMRHWSERFLKLMNLWAIESKCSEIRGLSMRKGWLRYLQNEGWTEHVTILKCPVKVNQNDNIVNLRNEVKS